MIGITISGKAYAAILPIASRVSWRKRE